MSRIFLVFTILGYLFLGMNSHANVIARSDLDGVAVSVLLVDGPPTDNVLGIAVDAINAKIYWTNHTTGTINRANLDGSGAEVVVSGLVGPSFIRLHLSAGKMYWSNFDTGPVPAKIQRANMSDGSDVEDIIFSPNPQGIALDTDKGKIYWIDFYQHKIARANLDGSNREDLITVGLGVPHGIDLDLSKGKMYWTDFGIDKIRRADLDGSNVEDLVSGTPEGLRDIRLDLSEQKMYWCDVRSDTIERANLDGSEREVLPIVSDDPARIDIAGGRLYLVAKSVVETAREVDIDIKPGNKQNVINPRGKGGMWVAILSDTDAETPFDPSSQVDIPTVEFGPDGAKAIRHKVKDKNKDGLGDLLLRFKVPETGMACGNTEAALSGETFDGQSFTATDFIKTVGCKKAKEAGNKKNKRK